MKTPPGYHKRINYRALVLPEILLALLQVMALAFAGCGPRLDPENPLFRFEIDLPVNEKSTATELTIQRGTTINLPVKLVSTRDETIEVRLIIDRDIKGNKFPQAITFSVPSEYITVPAGEDVTVGIIYHVGETVGPGLYHTSLSGNLREPIDGLAGTGRAIDIIVTDKPGTR